MESKEEGRVSEGGPGFGGIDGSAMVRMERDWGGWTISAGTRVRVIFCFTRSKGRVV